MKTINEEYKPFGLCSEEVQQQLRDAGNNGHKVEYYCDPNWEEKKACVFYNNWVYRVHVPETKKVPWDMEDYLKNNVGYLKIKAGNGCCAIDYLDNDKMYLSLNDYRFHYSEVSTFYTLPDGTELYKEAAE